MNLQHLNDETLERRREALQHELDLCEEELWIRDNIGPRRPIDRSTPMGAALGQYQDAMREYLSQAFPLLARLSEGS